MASSFVITSSQLVTPDVCQATQTLTSSLALPTQVNFGASYCAVLLPSSGSNAMPRLVAPIAVPSFGATL